MLKLLQKDSDMNTIYCRQRRSITCWRWHGINGCKRHISWHWRTRYLQQHSEMPHPTI